MIPYLIELRREIFKRGQLFLGTISILICASATLLIMMPYINLYNKYAVNRIPTSLVFALPRVGREL